MKNNKTSNKKMSLRQIINIVMISVILLVSTAASILFFVKTDNKVMIGEYNYKHNVIDEYKNVDNLIDDLKNENYEYTILYLGTPNNLTCCTYTKVVNDLAYKHKIRIKAMDLTPYQEKVMDKDENEVQFEKNNPEYQKLIDYIRELDPHADMRNYIVEETLNGENPIYRFKGYPLYYIIYKDNEKKTTEIKGFIRPEDYKNIVVEKDKAGYDILIDDAHTTKQRYKLKEELQILFNKILGIKDEKKEG